MNEGRQFPPEAYAPHITPLHIHIVMACQAQNSDICWASDTVQRYAEDLERAELIAPLNPANRREVGTLGSPFYILPRGIAWLHMLCSTPFPVRAFLDPRTSEALSCSQA